MELVASDSFFSQKCHFLNDREVSRVMGKAIQIAAVPRLCLSRPKHFLTFGLAGRVPQTPVGRVGRAAHTAPDPAFPAHFHWGRGGVSRLGRKATLGMLPVHSLGS